MPKHKLIFGPQAQKYDTARPRYPAIVIRDAVQSTGRKRPCILDLGCGTGISSRQLAKMGALVTGCDIDAAMLEAAKSHTDRMITYVQRQNTKLPFKDRVFDGVTAFTAFHWFVDNGTLREIRRVLKNSGTLCIVQPRHLSHSGYRDLLEKELKKKVRLRYSRKSFRPALASAGFRETRHFFLKKTNVYSLERYLNLLQSYSYWSAVPSTKQQKMLEILREHFSHHLVRGKIRERIELEVLILKK